MDKGNILRFWILLVAIIEIRGKRCGVNRKCFCYQNTRLITCFRKNLIHVPQFDLHMESQYDYLDLRWNNIQSVNMSDSFLQKLYYIDLRDNPINCTLIPKEANIKTDCFLHITKNRIESGSTKTDNESGPTTTKISPTHPITTDIISSKSTVTTVSHSTSTTSSVPSITQKPTTRIISYSQSSKISPRRSSKKSAGKSTSSSSSSSLSTVEIAITSTTTTTTTTSPIKTVTTSMSSHIPIAHHTGVDESETASIDFYLHITLGPLAGIYVISSLFIIVKQWMRRRHLRRMTMTCRALLSDQSTRSWPQNTTTSPSGRGIGFLSPTSSLFPFSSTPILTPISSADPESMVNSGRSSGQIRSAGPETLENSGLELVQPGQIQLVPHSQSLPSLFPAVEANHPRRSRRLSLKPKVDYYESSVESSV